MESTRVFCTRRQVGTRSVGSGRLSVLKNAHTWSSRDAALGERDIIERNVPGTDRDCARGSRLCGRDAKTRNICVWMTGN